MSEQTIAGYIHCYFTDRVRTKPARQGCCLEILAFGDFGTPATARTDEELIPSSIVLFYRTVDHLGQAMSTWACRMKSTEQSVENKGGFALVHENCEANAFVSAGELTKELAAIGYPDLNSTIPAGAIARWLTERHKLAPVLEHA